MRNDNAIMQIMQPVRVIDLMIKIDRINDNIPINTPYIILGKSVPCLKGFINNMIIEYTNDYYSKENKEIIKNIYEELTGVIISLKNTNNNINNTIKELFILLDELIDKIPMGIELEFMGENISCFNSMILLAKNNIKDSPENIINQKFIIEIYRIMHLNGHAAFYAKY